MPQLLWLRQSREKKKKSSTAQTTHKNKVSPKPLRGCRSIRWELAEMQTLRSHTSDPLEEKLPCNKIPV